MKVKVFNERSWRTLTNADVEQELVMVEVSHRLITRHGRAFDSTSLRHLQFPLLIEAAEWLIFEVLRISHRLVVVRQLAPFFSELLQVFITDVKVIPLAKLFGSLGKIISLILARQINHSS